MGGCVSTAGPPAASVWAPSEKKVRGPLASGKSLIFGGGSGPGHGVQRGTGGLEAKICKGRGVGACPTASNQRPQPATEAVEIKRVRLPSAQIGACGGPFPSLFAAAQRLTHTLKLPGLAHGAKAALLQLRRRMMSKPALVVLPPTPPFFHTHLSPPTAPPSSFALAQTKGTSPVAWCGAREDAPFCVGVGGDGG